jgi:hypothetical protein
VLCDLVGSRRVDTTDEEQIARDEVQSPESESLGRPGQVAVESITLGDHHDPTGHHTSTLGLAHHRLPRRMGVIGRDRVGYL